MENFELEYIMVRRKKTNFRPREIMLYLFFLYCRLNYANTTVLSLSKQSNRIKVVAFEVIIGAASTLIVQLSFHCPITRYFIKLLQTVT